MKARGTMQASILAAFLHAKTTPKREVCEHLMRNLIKNGIRTIRSRGKDPLQNDTTTYKSQKLFRLRDAVMKRSSCKYLP
jgi:hypothetical protein